MADGKEAGEEAARGTVIGESISIHGRLVGDEDLTLRGRLEGELTLTKTLVVEVTAIVKAEVAVKSAIVRGVVVGNITATESIELTGESRVVGDLRAPRVMIAEGASFRGRVQMGEVVPGSLTERSQRVAVRALAAVPRLPAAQPRLDAKGKTAKPIPPPPPGAGDGKGGAVAPLVAEVGKKKIVVKRKAR